MHHNTQYIRLALMTLLAFITMYILMYAMVNIRADIFPNYNQFYMAGLMTAPMIIIELLLMSTMYPNKRLNQAIASISLILGVFFFWCIRTQAFVDDAQFLKSMIPHHSSAILMCTHVTITTPEIRQLCANIITGQQKEIDLMRTLLERY